MKTGIFTFFLFILLFIIHSRSYGQSITVTTIDPPGGSSVKFTVKFNNQPCDSCGFFIGISDGVSEFDRPLGRYYDTVEYTKDLIFTGLLPNTYYEISKADTANGSGACLAGLNISIWDNFTTSVGPVVAANSVSNITSVSARLNGTINPKNVGGGSGNVDVYFDYGTTDSYGTTVSYGTMDASLTTDQSIFKDIAGLSAYTTYHYRSRADFSGVTTYGPDLTFTTLPVSPTITTQSVTLISTDTTVGNGNITSLGVPKPTQYGVVWNTAGNPTIADSKTTKGTAGTTGAFTSNITGLLPGTTYYVKAYATNIAGTVYGSQVSFTTLKIPTVTTQAVTSITTTTAVGNGNITDLGIPNPAQHGVVWNTTGNPTTADSKTTEGAAGATGAFTSNITGLTTGVTYYVKAYATNSVGTAYGAEVLFTTQKIPTVTTQAVTGILPTSATGNGNITDLGVPNPTQYGIVWNTTGNPDTSNSKTTEGPAGATGALRSNITGLTPGVTYYVKAYAINTVGIVYGGQVSFTSIKVPAVTTQDVTGITTIAAMGNGNITDLGVPNPTQHGVVWNTTGNPTIADNKTADGAVGATGVFVSNITGLSPGVTYYVKAYAINSAGTSYGAEKTFTTYVTITGTINWNGNPMIGISISCNGGASIITGADGKYSFDVTTGGTYTLAPVKLGFSFGVIQVTLNNVIVNTIQDFFATEHPLISVTPNPLDFGNVGQLTEGKISTVYINNLSLTKDLLINKIYLRSGSSPFEILNSIAKVPAQGSDSIKIRFKTDNLGDFSNILVFENNSINDTIVNVQITGKIITPNLSVTPTIIWFDTTTIIKPADTLKILIKNNMVNSKSAFLSVITITDKRIIGDTNSFHLIKNYNNVALGTNQIDEIFVEFFPRSTGFKTTTLIIECTDPFSPKIFVKMMGVGSGSPKVISSPNQVDFGIVGYGEKKDTAIILRNTGNITMNLGDILLNGDGKENYSLEKCLKKIFEYNQTDTIKVHYWGMLPIGEKPAWIEITSDDPVQNPYKINLSGYLKTPLLYKPMLRIYFNNVMLGNYIDTTVRIKNIGNDILKISKIYIDGDCFSDFSVSGNPKELNPGEELPIKARFRPLGIGSRYSRIAIQSNDALFLETSIILIGESYPAGGLSTPVPVYPMNNENNVSTTLSVKWKKVENAISYTFQLYKDTNNTHKIILSDSSIVDTFRIVTGLKTNQKYCWKVKAKNDFSESGWTDSCIFTTLNTAPSMVLLLQPKNNETVDLFYPSRPLIFRWSRSFDPDEGDIVKYSIFIEGNNYNYSNLNQIDTSIVLDIMSNLIKSNTYRWYIQATDGRDSVQTEKLSFKTSDKTTGVKDEKAQITKYELKQNYPNPFNPSTVIGYQIPSDNYVELKIYDLMGREIVKVVSENQSAGYYEITWNAARVPSGMYYYKITAGGFSDTKKLLLLK